MKRVKIKSRKYPNNPEINWDFEASDDSYEAKLSSVLGRKDLEEERIVQVGSEPYEAEDVLEEIPADDDNPARVRLRAQYVVEVEDISAEIEAKEQAKQKLAAAKNDLKQVKKLVQDAKNADTQNKRDRVMKDMAKAILQLAKAQGLADPNDSEDAGA
jgi:hypothetical protein